jgi:ribosome-associated protein
MSEEATARPAEGDADSRATALLLADLLDDRQGQDIILLKVGPLVGYTEWFVVATGRSDRQVKALASHLERRCRDLGLRPIGTEGTERGHWALVDYGDVVAHIFREEERYFYDLESLWAEAERITYPPPGHVSVVPQAPRGAVEEEETSDPEVEGLDELRALEALYAAGEVDADEVDANEADADEADADEADADEANDDRGA